MVVRDMVVLSSRVLSSQLGHSGQCFINGNIHEQVLHIKTHKLLTALECNIPDLRNEVLRFSDVAGIDDPAIAERIRVISLASAYVGKPIDDTIGRHGMFSLWIFGNPYCLCGWVKHGESLDRCCSVISPCLSKVLRSSLILLSIYLVGSLFSYL